MDWLLIAVLLLAGLGMLVAELVFVPGTTFVGLIGFLLTLAGIYLSYDFYGYTVGTSVLSVSIFLGAMGTYYSFNPNTWDRFALKDSIDGKVSGNQSDLLNVADEGRTISALRPIGKAQFGNETFEVRTLGKFLDSGRAVKIIKIDGRRIFVTPLEEV